MAAQQTFWAKTKSGGKLGFDKLYSIVDKLGPPVNKLSNKLGSEAFWPTSMDKECDKAARILRSFCKDGFYDQDERPTSTDGPRQKQTVLKKIPAEVIRDAQGLAIFTTMRTGLWVSGSGGSGVLVARKADGSWSSPSGLQIQTMGLGFLVGVDIYDCVLVINTQKALEGFQRLRATLGGDLSATAGPVGMGAIIDTEVHKRQAPVFTYLKSRGFYAGVGLDGTVFIERTDENERFYGEKITAQDILKGKVRHPPLECRGLYETLKAAEGDKNFDPALLPSEAPPSDFDIVPDGPTFGVPDKDDPDPYGVLQLEKQGMVIREAGTQERASWEQFTFSPSITSPVYDTFERRSNRDSGSTAISRRTSWMTHAQAATAHLSAAGEPRSSRESLKTPVSMSDMGTQTDDLPPPPSSPGIRSFRSSATHSKRPSMDHIPENHIAPPSPSVRSHSGSWSGRKRSVHSIPSPPSTPPARTSLSGEEQPAATTSNTPELKATSAVDSTDASGDDVDEDDEDDEDDEAIIVEEPIVQSIHKATAPKVLQKARMVNVPARGPPPILPPRNPNRNSGPRIINGERPSSRMSNISAVSAISDNTLSVPPVTGSNPVSPLDNGPPDAIFSKMAGGGPANDEHVSATSTPAHTPLEKRDPWPGVLARHQSLNHSQESLDVPGAFQSFPATPNEEKEQPHVKS